MLWGSNPARGAWRGGCNVCYPLHWTLSNSPWHNIIHKHPLRSWLNVIHSKRPMQTKGAYRSASYDVHPGNTYNLDITVAWTAKQLTLPGLAVCPGFVCSPCYFSFQNSLSRVSKYGLFSKDALAIDARHVCLKRTPQIEPALHVKGSMFWFETYVYKPLIWPIVEHIVSTCQVVNNTD